MKIQTNVIESQSNMAFADTTRMSIDPTSMAHIVRVLTELYSDPAQSIVREYAANGLDSHMMAGQTKPVEITFPSYLSPSFVVRDFGVGMSRQEMQTVYSKYGASTKRETNDQIGAFGLGAKSALALVASFTVISVKDGKRNTVVIAKDEDGVASLNFLDEVETDEPNGVVVKVPVTNVNDFDRVKRLNIFLGWQPGTVLVDGKAPASIHDASTFSTLGDAGWFSVAPETIGHRGGIRVMVGPVMYEIPYNTASNLFANDLLAGWHFGTLTQRLVLNVENGSVALTPSREELIFNRMTKDTLREVAAKAIPQVFGKILEQIDQAETLRDALRIASEVAAFVRPAATTELTWQGKAFHTATAATGFFAKTDWLKDQQVEPEAQAIIDHMVISYKAAGAMRLSALGAQDGLAIAGSEFDKYVIITDAERKENGGYTVASYISTWFRTEVQRRNGRIFITTLAAKDLNENFVAMAHKVIPAADVRRIVLESRRKPAGHKPTPRSTEPKVLTVSLMKSARFYSEKDSLVTTPVADLKPETTYVIAQASADRTEGTMSFDNAIYAFFRNSKLINFNQRKAVEAFIDLIDKRGLRLVVLPATANRGEVEQAIANISTPAKVLAESFQGEAPTEAERDFINFLSSRSNGWQRFNTDELFTGGEKALINEVANETTREFLTLLRRVSSKRGESLLAAANLAQQIKGLTVDENLDKAIKEFRRIPKAETTRRYPLLVVSITEETARDAVDYINMVDARNN